MRKNKKVPGALAILLMSVIRSAPEFVAIIGGPSVIFPTAVFESQEPIIRRESADLLNKLRSLGFGISGPFLGFSVLSPREGPSGWPFGVAVSVECPYAPLLKSLRSYRKILKDFSLPVEVAR